MKTIGSWWTLVIVGGASWLGSSVLAAQDSTLQFEVASVRVSGPAPRGTPQGRGMTRGGPGTNDPERFTYERALFQQLVMAAYGVQRDQIKGPDWATTDDLRGAARFDISAKVPPGATKGTGGDDAAKPAGGAVPSVTSPRNSSVFRLRVGCGQGGSKLKESRGPLDESEQTTPGAGGAVNLKTEKDGFPQLFPGRNMGGVFKDGIVRIRFRDYPLFDLTQQLSIALSSHLIDRTELGGKYDFTLEFALPENAFIVAVRAILPLSPGQVAPLNKDGPNPAQQDALPIISAAIEKQLGLKLEATRISVDTLVIDHVEKTPTEN